MYSFTFSRHYTINFGETQMTIYTPLRCSYSVMVADPIVAKILFLDTGNFPSFSSYLNQTLQFSLGNWGVANGSGPAVGAPLSLGAASSFGALASSSLTNTGPSTVNGDIGVSPGVSITGFPPGTFSGTKHQTDATAANAESDANSAYTAGQALPGGTTIVAGTYANGAVVTPGVYTATSSLNFTGGTVTLDGQGNPNATWVFQINSTLVTATSTKLLLINGAQPQNVWWLVGSSATFGTSTIFAGNVIAQASVTDNGSSSITGRVIGLTAAVTLNNTTLFIPQSSSGVPTINAFPTPPRTDHVMAFDGSSVMLFGGRGTEEVFQDTWLWTATGWTKASPATSPTGRYKAQSAYLAGTGVVMFGGENRQFMLRETWIWNGTTWTQVALPNTVNGSPAARTGHMMAGGGGQVLLFGGRGSNFQSNHTWSFNGTTWTRLLPATSPSIRSEGCMAYATTGGLFVMFGGQNEYGYLNETWVYNGTNWLQVTVPAGTGPAGRVGAQMAYDSTSNKVIMFGGISAGTNYPSNETWSFDALTLTWTQL
jgi:hypothetical protein